MGEDIPCDQWQNVFGVVGDQIGLGLTQRCEVCCTTQAAQGYLSSIGASAREALRFDLRCRKGVRSYLTPDGRENIPFN